MADGHTVIVETGAGLGSGFSDAQYAAGRRAYRQGCRRRLGGSRFDPESEGADRAGMAAHQARPDHFHVFPFRRKRAADPRASGLLARSASRMRTVALPSRELPLLTPMSEVAGRMAVQEGAKYLEKLYGGRGLLLGGVPGVPPAKVVILGGGVVGVNAAKMAAGLGAHVVLLDVSLEKLRYLSDVLPANVQLVFSNRAQPAGADRDGRSGDRRGADPRRRGAQADTPRQTSRRCATVR